MPSVELYASRDRKERISLELPGFDEPLVVTYYPNRLTTERAAPNGNLSGPEHIEAQAARDATLFCDLFASWDLTGPLYNHAGETIVPEGEIIPIEPDIVRLIPPLFRIQVIQALTVAIVPKATASPPSPAR